MSTFADPFSRAWIEVRAEALQQNLRSLQDRVGPDLPCIPMVKANAYGLGVADALRAMEGMFGGGGPWGYGVATVAEGEELRVLGVSGPVLLFAPTPPGELPRAAAAGLTPAVSDAETLRRLRRWVEETGGDVSVQVEVDTGMGRAGFLWDRVEEWGGEVAVLASTAGIRWTGIYTHFHSADHPHESAGPGPHSVEVQAERFRSVLEQLSPPAGTLRHLGNSAGALRRPDLSGDAVRPGIFLYGGWAGEDLEAPAPVVALRARVALVKEVPAGATVGYGATYRASRPSRWATLAIGYGDGLRRRLSNRGFALLGGSRVPMVGRISMDMTVVDITGLPGVVPGDVATLLGVDGDEEITLEEMAMGAETNNYEILTGFSRRLPRVWLGAGEIPPWKREGASKDGLDPEPRAGAAG